MAKWMGARSYPRERLNSAWMLELAGHFHRIHLERNERTLMLPDNGKVRILLRRRAGSCFCSAALRHRRPLGAASEIKRATLKSADAAARENGYAPAAFAGVYLRKSSVVVIRLIAHCETSGVSRGPTS